MDKVAQNIVSVLKDTVTLLIENTMDEEVSHEGGLLLDILDRVSERIGTYDVRNIDGTSLEDSMDSFYVKVASFDENSGGHITMCLSHFQMHRKSLNRVLNEEWSTNLPKFPQAASAATDNLTPEKKKEKILTIFEKFTPLKNKKITKECPFCGQSFGLRSLKNHIRHKHKEDQGKKGEKEKNSEEEKEGGLALLGTCRMPDKKDPTLMCGRRFPSDGIKRHLKEYHLYECPNKPLRGFTSNDGGLSYSPLFLRKAEEDPVFDVVIQALDSSPAGSEDEDDEETPAVVVEIDPTRPKKRLFSDVDKDKMEDRSVSVDMSLEEQKAFESAVDESLMTVNFQADTSYSIDDTDKVDKSAGVDMSFEDEQARYSSDKISSSGVEKGTDEVNLTDNSEMEILDYQHDVVDVVCEDYSRRIKVIKVSFADEDQANIELIVDRNNNDDSDFEEGDLPEFCHSRVSRKTERHDNRINLSSSKLAEKDGNSNFVTKFNDFMANRLISKVKNDTAADKCFGHIYRYNDSLLEYESKLNEDFLLDRLLDFKSDNYLDLKFPHEWIKSTCPNNPSRAQEKLKAHKFIRDFILSYAENTDLGGSTESMLKKSLIVGKVEKIGRDITSKGLFAEYRKLIQVENNEKRQARMIANPSEGFNLARAVTTWNSSNECKEREEHFLKIYQEATSKRQSPKSRPFTTLGHYIRFRLCVADKNRPGSYHLLNSDVKAAKKLWWPDGYTGFGDLPPGWNENVPPYPGAPPSCWSITIPGKNLKKLVLKVV